MRFRTLIFITVSVIGLCCASLLVYEWQQAHLWPFSSGTQDEAFLGTTFGMSPQEVSRTLRKQDAQLLDYDEFKKAEALVLIDPFPIEFKPYLNSDERDFFSKFMPSIEMFGGTAQAEFEFRKNKLEYVSVHLRSMTKSEEVIASVKAALEKHYRFVNREESKEVPGAYRLLFTSGPVSQTLWVNLTDSKKPVIRLWVKRTAAESERRREIELREQAAFGH